MRITLVVLAVSGILSVPATAQSLPTIDPWSGPYVGGSVGFGWGRTALEIPSFETVSVTTESCTLRGTTYELASPPPGSSIGFPNRFPAEIVDILGLENIPGTAFYKPTKNVAFDLRNTTGENECLTSNVYYLAADGTYQGGSFVPGEGVTTEGFPADFLIGDFGDEIVATTTTTGGPTAEQLGPFAAANVDAETLALLQTLPGTTLDVDVRGFTGAVQAGYNWRVGKSVLLGIEADLALTGIDGATTIGTAKVSSDIDWYGTVRGRVGTVSGPWLFYATGGLAYGAAQVTYDVGGVTAGETDRLVGYAVGGGLEFALAEHQSIRTQYLFADMGGGTFAAGTDFDIDGRVQLNTITIGFNTRF